MRWLPLAFLLACSGGTADESGTTATGTSTGGTTTGTAGTTSAVPCEGTTPEVTEITPAELDQMLQDKDFLLVNVHVPRDGEIPGTDVHIAYTDTAALEAEIGAKDAKTVLYCKTGPMSAIAAADLIDAGYCNIYDLPAGMNGWEGSGFPLDP